MALRLSAHMTVMQNAAQKAARRLLRDFNEVEQLQVSVKGPSDFVSQADLRAEATLREELARARPGYADRALVQYIVDSPSITVLPATVHTASRTQRRRATLTSRTVTVARTVSPMRTGALNLSVCAR